MRKKTKIIILLLLALLVAIGGGTAIYFTQYYEDIEQKVTEVTLSYQKKAERNSSYYFTGQRSEEDFDQSLFVFDEIKDYTVNLPFREKEYPVVFHIIDDVSPAISLPVDQIDLYEGFDLKDLYVAKDEKSKVKVALNMEEEDFTEGEHEFCVTATDESGNSEKKCKVIKVVDTTPKVDLVSKLSFDYDYANSTLEQLLNDYYKKRGLTNQVAVSYHNFVSGESYFVNGDQWMVSGSTYKLPLNMYYYEQENAGKISQASKLPYREYSFEEGGPIGDTLYKPGDEIAISELQYYSIVYSDNTASRILFDGLGGWGNYREAIKKYSTISYESPFYANNFTVRYMNDVLTYLYQNAGSFPELCDRLFGVAPGDMLKRYVHVPIMQKDGCFEAAYNTAGIVYADKPYAVAVYTSLGEGGPNVIGEINAILYQYSQAH